MRGVALGWDAPALMHCRAGRQSLQAVAVKWTTTGIRITIEIMRNSYVPHLRMQQSVQNSPIHNRSAANASTDGEI